MTAPERVPLGAALALLLALVSLTGPLAPVLTAVMVAILSVMVAVGWPELLELPSPVGTRIVVAGTGILGAAVAIGVDDAIGPLVGAVSVCAVGVFASFVHQMMRRERDHLTESLTGTVSGALMTGLGSCWVLAQEHAASHHSSGLLAALAISLAAALLLDATSLPALWRLVLGVIGSTGLTMLVADSVLGVDLWQTGLLGLCVGLGALGVHQLVGSPIHAEEPAPSLTIAAAPVVTIGVVAQIAVNLLT